MLASCFPSAFRLNCFSLLCSTIWGGEGGERDFNYARGSWYSKHMETAVVILLTLFFLDESQRERSSHATSDTSCHFTLLGGSPAEESSMLLWWQGKVYFCREGVSEWKWQNGKTGKVGQAPYTPFLLHVPSLSHYTPFLATQSFLKAPAPNFSQNA